MVMPIRHRPALGLAVLPGRLFASARWVVAVCLLGRCPGCWTGRGSAVCGRSRGWAGENGDSKPAATVQRRVAVQTDPHDNGERPRVLMASQRAGRITSRGLDIRKPALAGGGLLCCGWPVETRQALSFYWVAAEKALVVVAWRHAFLAVQA